MTIRGLLAKSKQVYLTVPTLSFFHVNYYSGRESLVPIFCNRIAAFYSQHFAPFCFSPGFSFSCVKGVRELSMQQSFGYARRRSIFFEEQFCGGKNSTLGMQAERNEEVVAS